MGDFFLAQLVVLDLELSGLERLRYSRREDNCFISFMRDKSDADVQKFCRIFKFLFLYFR